MCWSMRTGSPLKKSAEQAAADEGLNVEDIDEACEEYSEHLDAWVSAIRD